MAFIFTWENGECERKICNRNLVLQLNVVDVKFTGRNTKYVEQQQMANGKRKQKKMEMESKGVNDWANRREIGWRKAIHEKRTSHIQNHCSKLLLFTALQVLFSCARFEKLKIERKNKIIWEKKGKKQAIAHTHKLALLRFWIQLVYKNEEVIIDVEILCRQPSRRYTNKMHTNTIALYIYVAI